MYLKNITFNNFKNLSGTSNLSDGINILVSPNGTGKTNFLEGMYYLTFGNSFRNGLEVNNASWDSRGDYFTLKGEIDDKDEGVQVEMRYENSNGPGKKRFLVNEVGRKRDTFRGYISPVIFAPQTVDLVSGSPDGRRKAVNDVLSILDPDYSRLLNEYRSVVRNRNKILSNLQNNIGMESELTYWNEALIKLGGDIVFGRLKFFRGNAKIILERAKDLFNGEIKGLKINYATKFLEDKKITRKKIISNFEQKIRNNIRKEILAGVTLYGPHREDYDFLLEKMSLKESGSRGQQRLASFIFVLSLLDELDKKDRSVVLLLDDVMSELDKSHRKNIEKLLSSISTQMVITSAEEANFTKGFLNKSTRIKNFLED
ncbi:MAG TPA: DNA replication and repair protein RecF [bacterium]|nr:DNA replication and repair protein RecF [bacterium]